MSAWEAYIAERDDYDKRLIPTHAHYTGCHFCENFRERAAQAGQNVALLHADPNWVKRAETWLKHLAQGTEFTADDLVESVGLPKTGSTNAIGALFASFARRELIEKVGYTEAKRMSSHSRVIRVWRRA